MTDRATIHQRIEALPAAKLAAAARLLDHLEAVDVDEAEPLADHLEGYAPLMTLRALRRAGALSTLYDTDFYVWTQTQAAALRDMNWAALDLEHLAEEIESLGKSDRRAVESYLEVIAMHLLKWVYQPVRRSPSWRRSVRTSRGRLEKILRDNKTLGRHAREELAAIYRSARLEAADETGLPLAMFPETCPWSIDQLLDKGFWPEDEPPDPVRRVIIG